MNEKMIDWQDLQLFIAVARSGGLSPASKVTNTSPATLGRRMLKLEQSLGRELFRRLDRGYELLPNGLQLLDALLSIEDKIQKVTFDAAGSKQQVFKVSAGTWTTLALIKNVDSLFDSRSGIQVRFISTEQKLKIEHREIHVGIRNERPTDLHLVCKKLNRVRFAVYSTNSAADRFIICTASTSSSSWVKNHYNGQSVFQVSTPRNGLDLALLGKGKLVLPTFIGNEYPTLHQRGSVISELDHDQWAVFHQDDRDKPEIRLFLDKAKDILKNA